MYNRLTDKSMGLCLDPSDWNLRITGLSVGHFIGYPMVHPEKKGYGNRR